MRKRAADAIGLNYFSAVAPCTAVKEFQGRFGQFVAMPGAGSETFGFFYPFGWGHKEVRITLFKRPSEESISIVSEIGPVSDDGGPGQ